MRISYWSSYWCSSDLLCHKSDDGSPARRADRHIWLAILQHQHGRHRTAWTLARFQPIDHQLVLGINIRQRKISQLIIQKKAINEYLAAECRLYSDRKRVV